mgnify:CR=1 FL=1
MFQPQGGTVGNTGRMSAAIVQPLDPAHRSTLMPSTPFPARGLYAITDTDLCARHGLVNSVESVINGGAAVIQYRNKSFDDTTRFREAGALLQLCRDRQLPLIINDDVELAAQIAADGVHIGADDGTLGEARSRLGDQAIVGVSCYASVTRALEAQAQGADYVAFGSFFPSTTKPQAKPVTLAQLRQARAALSVPIVGIGGIELSNAASLINAGVDLIAVISGLFAQDDPETAARHLVALF